MYPDFPDAIDDFFGILRDAFGPDVLPGGQIAKEVRDRVAGIPVESRLALGFAAQPHGIVSSAADRTQAEASGIAATTAIELVHMYKTVVSRF